MAGRYRTECVMSNVWRGRFGQISAWDRRPTGMNILAGFPPEQPIKHIF
ncbi:hypothetical protein RM543_10420 [Roseicyclus sp. F158]|uniref:Uncharacterized protein n=1 Tax=Tropicimonas omnivorans TaxID=3075590 RepID=A0ABU3DHA4_9RHOB|nr:hypothetical protein [Roseicyclus sp. F158]MDT0683101.1 hypothetical protein [Roseicyclus sp. F158]